MYRLRPAAERGHADHGWLRTWHSFSFADYHDPAHMGFRSLRVINEDHIDPGGIFSPHRHRDMEIVSWVLEGALAHEDDLGHGSTIRPGQVQRMTAGRGIVHSEANPQASAATHMLQIWILPDERGLEPGWEEATFSDLELRNQWRTIVSPEAEAGALHIHQDARIMAARLDAESGLRYEAEKGRGLWLQVARGAVETPAGPLRAGDGLAIEDEPVLEIAAQEEAELLLFDLADS
jgi:quercetin 2,3-dioxygenase